MKNKFDEKAKDFDKNPAIQNIALAFYKTLKKNVPPSKEMHALDYGCGSGLVGIHLYKDVKSLVMMDSSKGMLDILREKVNQKNISNITIKNYDIYEAQQELETFDLIYMNNVLHHIEDINEFFIEISKLLKSGGYFCIGDLVKEPGTFHNDNKDVKHFGFEKLELSSQLKQHHFYNIHWEVHHIEKRPDKNGIMRDYPMFFISSLKK